MKHCAFALLVLIFAPPAGAQAATTYAATTVGPYKSTDGGVTWQPVKVTVASPFLQGIPVVPAIAVDPANPANVYFVGRVSTTSAFFKSTDAGQNWSAVLLPGTNVNDVSWLCIDPVATNRLYLEADNKLLRSADSGATWTDTPALSDIAGIGGVIGIAIDPNTPGVVYATSSGGGISKSTDFGSTWTSFRFSFSPTLGGIFVDPTNSRRLYVARRFGQGCLNQSRVFIDCGLFSSVDAGQTWQIVPNPGTSESVAFDRATGDIYAGVNETGVGVTVLKSSDQGNTWTPLLKLLSGLSNGPKVSVDPGAAGSVYLLGDMYFLGGNGQNQKSTDGGATWKKVTIPPYCTTSGPSCPSVAANVIPGVYGLAYEAPPPPPAVSVTSTVSAASLQPGPVAAESIVISTGTHIATGTASADIDQPSMTLAGTTVKVTDSAGVTRPAVLFSVSATQVTYQIPPGTAAGPATVTITAGDGVTGGVAVQVVAVAPGVYTLNPAGLVKAYVIRVSNGNQFVEDVYEVDPTGAVIARPITISNGDQVYLLAYGSGFRAAGADVTVTIGGDSPPVLYAGPQGEAAGVDQFNILIPPDLAAAGQQSVSLILTAAGQAANAVNLVVK